MSPQSLPKRRRLAFALLTMVWMIAVVSGTLLLWRFKSLPGTTGTAPADWPAQSRLERLERRNTLVMLAHPKCPCTSASLTELDQLVRAVGTSVDPHVLFVLPASAPEGWEKTPLFEKASAIPGVRVHVDRLGKEAALFGAQTSGDTVLFDPQGKRLFHGGITASRGHVGPSLGRSRIESLVLRGTADHQSSAVYGCALDTPPHAN